jgi:hypothetical protein
MMSRAFCSGVWFRELLFGIKGGVESQNTIKTAPGTVYITSQKYCKESAGVYGVGCFEPV